MNKNSKLNLIASIILIVVSLLAIGSYIMLSVNAQIDWKKYLAAAILSIFFILIGIKDIIKYIKSN